MRCAGLLLGDAFAVVVVGVASIASALPAPGAPSKIGGNTETANPTSPTPIRPVFLPMLENAEIGGVLQDASYEQYLASHLAGAGGVRPVRAPLASELHGSHRRRAVEPIRGEEHEQRRRLAPDGEPDAEGPGTHGPLPCDSRGMGLCDIDRGP